MNKSTCLIFSLLAITIPCAAQQSKAAARQKVVFVCEHGAAKSVMAAAEFERLAKQKGVAFEIISRGTIPDAEVAAPIRQHLLADGMDIGTAKPAKVSAKDLEGATTVVTFGPNLTSLMPKGTNLLDWSATPSPSKDYRVAREYIVKQLGTLVETMQKAEH